MDHGNVHHACVTHVGLIWQLNGENGGGSAGSVESEHAVCGGVGAVVEEGTAASPEVAVLVDNCRHSQIHFIKLCIRCINYDFRCQELCSEELGAMQGSTPAELPPGAPKAPVETTMGPYIRVAVEVPLATL